MILLDVENAAILNILKKKSVITETGKFESVEASVTDDDGIRYRLFSSPDDKSKIFVDIKVPFVSDYKSIDANKYLSNFYGTMWSSTSDATYRVVHDLNLGEKERDESCMKVAMFRRHLYASFLDHFYSKMSSSCARVTLKIRKGEHITFDCTSDRVNATFTIAYQDQNDIIISRVFMQEFKEGKKAGRNAPLVSTYLKDPPPELSGCNLPVGPEVGHISLGLSLAHGSKANIDKTVDLIHNFLPYIKYHLSCTKAYLHSRLRSKTEDFIKIINRARPEATSKGTDKKAPSTRANIKG